jgi:DNA/RNA endonuclease YhcR with UshA esterase domain
MKIPKIYRSLFTLISIAALAVPTALAQRGVRQGGIPKYNPATEVTVRGTVEEIRQVTGRRGWAGTHLTLKTDGGSLDVHLGPSNFVAAKKFAISKGDQVEVIGSKVQYQGHDALVAREIKKGNHTLTLRNAQGIPEWSRGARRY